MEAYSSLLWPCKRQHSIKCIYWHAICKMGLYCSILWESYQASAGERFMWHFGYSTFLSSTVCKSMVSSKRACMISLSAWNKHILAVKIELELQLECVKPMWGSNLSHKQAITMSTRAEGSKHLTIGDVKHLWTSSGIMHICVYLMLLIYLYQYSDLNLKWVLFEKNIFFVWLILLL